ncbi:MAG: hypothetical protein H7222_13300 [Methylotenera sp.]|nr:hypothetical protein [Oligoflexia bacterium]
MNSAKSVSSLKRASKQARAFAVLAITLSAALAGAHSSQASASQAQFGLSPDNNQKLLFSTFDSARNLLRINMYEFKNPDIADALISRIQAGVTLQLLIESQPVFGMSTEGKEILGRIHRAMKASGNAKHRLFILSGVKSGPTKNRRWAYDHAKYVIVDTARVQISSENFNPSGHPAPGKVGNRGWDVVLQDSVLIQKMSQMFQNDTASRNADIVTVTPSGQLPFPTSATARIGNGGLDNRTANSINIGSGEITHTSLITSPASMPSLQKLMRSANQTLDIEQMSLPLSWKSDSVNPSPWVIELIQAARRGVHVRVLLNDERVWGKASDDGEEATHNELTIQYLRQMSKCYKLPISGKVVDVDAAQISYIHNKGMIVDGRRVLISSINGTENSMGNNREVAVVVEGTSAGNYFTNAFNQDWNHSGNALSGSPQPAGCPPQDGTLGNVQSWSGAAR